MPTSHDPSLADDPQIRECVALEAQATLPTRYGTFTSYVFRVTTAMPNMSRS